MISLEEYRNDILRNIKIMSRTANGVLDLSTSATKVEAMILTDGNIAKEVALNNVNNAIEFLYDNRNKKFNNYKDIICFIEELALIVDNGIVNPDMLYRQGQDTKKYHYVKIVDIPKTLNSFAKKLLSLFNNKNYDGLYAATISEFYINVRGHFFSDGCGKISILFSAYCLMRANIKVASYVSRNLYFKYEPKTYDDDNADIARFYEYFKLIHIVKDFICRCNKKTGLSVTNYDLFSFSEENDDLLKLVLKNEKTATSSLKVAYEKEKTDIPSVGLFSVILNKDNKPKCLIRNTNVSIMPFNKMPESLIRKEGEGDYTLAYWKYVHRDFFEKDCLDMNMSFNTNMDVVFEEFELVYAE